MDGDRVESMTDAMKLFIRYVEEKHVNDPAQQATVYADLLLHISNGTWFFPVAFGAWRRERGL